MEYKTLVKKRAIIKGCITKLKNFIINFNTESDDFDLLKIKFQKLLEYEKNFYEVQDELEIVDESTEHDLIDRDTYDDIFDDLKLKYKKLLDISGNNLVVPNVSKINQQVSLKPIDIEPFTGDVRSWPKFFDLFVNLVHKRTDITGVEKFYYLNNSLKGTALDVIKNLSVTSDNYETALKLLKARFDNKRIIATKHAMSIINLQSPKKENSDSFSKLIDEINGNLNALKNLDINYLEFIVIQLISQHLNSNTLREWEATLKENEFPKIDNLISFLESKRRLLESTDTIQMHSDKGLLLNSSSSSNSNYKKYDNKFKSNSENRYKSSFHVKSDVNACNFCKDNHSLFRCDKFIKLDVNQRKKFVFQEKLCLNCFSKQHSVKNCLSIHRCKKCSQKHNTLIHLNTVNNSESTDSQAQPVNSSYFTLKSLPNKSILLSTVVVNVKDKFGNLRKARALLDSASMISFCTERFASSLGLKTKNNVMPISGINNVVSKSRLSINLNISSRYEEFSFDLQCHILPSITGLLPNEYVDVSDWEIPENVFLADPNFNVPDHVDILIGAQYFLTLLKPAQAIHSQNHTVLQETRLGFIVSGQISVNRSHGSYQPVSLLVSNEQLSTQLESFWKTEELDNRVLSVNDSFAEKHFIENTFRDNQGRFVVSLPRKDNTCLGESYSYAVQRFNYLERRFSKDERLKADYIQFMNEYHNLDHMQPVSSNNMSYSISEQFFLPHHAVVRDCSTTTRTRVVFDGSAKTSNGKSLNSILATGPLVQQDLFSIVLRFRTHVYVLSGDIPKMYRQIRINPRDYPLQRILWYDDEFSKIIPYDLKTVTYGLAPSSFLATRCLVEIATQNLADYPSACNSIKNDFYVDDLLTGCDDANQLEKLYKDISFLLNQYGFSLHKCYSNVFDLFGKSDSYVSLDKDEQIKALGLSWDPQADDFVYNVVFKNKDIVCTKRVILSTISSLFDPLGLLAPIIVSFKVFMQELWCANLQWDEEIPLSLKEKWSALHSAFSSVSSFKIPRLIKVKEDVLSIQLHGFCDASSTAYGACLFVRSVNVHRDVTIHLLCSKSRVAPVKQISIPRLELNAALLLSRLVSKVISILGIKFDNVYLWSDSKIVLYWLSSLPNRWKTFVANRVCEIQELTQGCIWQHVSSKDNPADILSRGCSPAALSSSKIWWQGPSFLKDSQESWSSLSNVSEIAPSESLKEERKRNNGPFVVTCLNVSEEVELTTPFSSLVRALHVISYCRRFVHNSKYPNDRLTGNLTVKEINSTLNNLVRQAQIIYFSIEIKDLKKNKMVSKKSKLVSLNPFIDEEGLIRVGGRLNFSNLSYNAKNPMILDPHSHLTKLIVVSEHVRLLHGGLQLVHSSLRQKYWIINAKILIRSVIHKCISCIRYRSQPQSQLLGQLPKQRVTITRPFQSVGIDYAGPLFIRHGGRRTRSSCTVTTKAYVALFVCLSTKAVHIELVSDLSTDCFLAALRRFVGRRGLPSSIFSDNGKNFSGANNQIKELYDFFKRKEFKSKTRSFALSNGIKWHFIPPYSPSWGGLWEAAVKSLKFHLRRVMGNSVLTFEELSTLLVQIEACLNSRPLYLPSSDASDQSPITPGHFLIFAPLTSLPDPDYVNDNVSHFSRWQLTQKILRDFWRKWSIDYLHSLQQRNKCKFPEPNLNVGDVVILKESNVPPLMWKLGVITKLYPGKDQLVRVADVKTNNTLVKRPVIKLIKLPTSDKNFVDKGND